MWHTARKKQISIAMTTGYWSLNKTECSLSALNIPNILKSHQNLLFQIFWRTIKSLTDIFNLVLLKTDAPFKSWDKPCFKSFLNKMILSLADLLKKTLFWLQKDHNHMFIRQGTGLQGQALFRTKLTFRPHSTESFTHRKMTLSLADRSLKTSGIKVLSQVGHDPDQNRYEKIKVCCIFFNLCYFLNNLKTFWRKIMLLSQKQATPHAHPC